MYRELTDTTTDSKKKDKNRIPNRLNDFKHDHHLPLESVTFIINSMTPCAITSISQRHSTKSLHYRGTFCVYIFWPPRWNVGDTSYPLALAQACLLFGTFGWYTWSLWGTCFASRLSVLWNRLAKSNCVRLQGLLECTKTGSESFSCYQNKEKQTWQRNQKQKNLLFEHFSRGFRTLNRFQYRNHSRFPNLQSSFNGKLFHHGSITCPENSLFFFPVLFLDISYWNFYFWSRKLHPSTRIVQKFFTKTNTEIIAEPFAITLKAHLFSPFFMKEAVAMITLTLDTTVDLLNNQTTTGKIKASN